MKEAEFSTHPPVHNAEAGAAPANQAPIHGASGSPEAFERFLRELATCGHMRRSAEQAGLTLEAIARRERHDPEFKERLKDARAARRYLIADALLEEGVLGRETVDAVNGKVSRTRNIAVLTALARKDGELDHDRPQAAVQINNNQLAADPRLIAAQNELRKRLDAMGAKPALPIIEGEIAAPAPATDDINDGSDLL